MKTVKPVVTDQKYLIVSADSHVGPSLERQLRPYCPIGHLNAFDDFVRDSRRKSGDANLESRFSQFATEPAVQAIERSANCAGLQDPTAFLGDMDADGVTASVIFAGGGNGELVPWIGGLIKAAGQADTPLVLLETGARIWNRWLVDFVSVAPTRLRGVAQIPFEDVEAAIREVLWAHEHGLGAINLPAPRLNILPYNDMAWEPLWDTVEAVGLPLVTHVGSGDSPYAPESNPGYYRIFAFETRWLSRSGLSHMIFGGVFERHPSLRLIFTEQRADWVGETLTLMDSLFCDPNRVDDGVITRKPSEYWRSNCYIGGSFLARYEVAKLDEIGRENLMWGSDYPHPEGTWPRTSLALRNTFAGIPESDVRAILGLNAVRVFGLDIDEMEALADRIGPTPQDLSVPLTDEEFPEHRGLAFREFGAYA